MKITTQNTSIIEKMNITIELSSSEEIENLLRDIDFTPDIGGNTLNNLLKEIKSKINSTRYVK